MSLQHIIKTNILINLESIDREEKQPPTSIPLSHKASSTGWGLRDSWNLLTLQVRAALSSRARGQVLELIKARLSLRGPWEHVPPNTHTSKYHDKLVKRNRWRYDIVEFKGK